MDAIRTLLADDSRVAYALVFGSHGRGTAHATSDVDVAIGLTPGVLLDVRVLGTLVSDLERAAGRAVDLVLLDEAPPALAYRVFRDGVVLVERDHRALADRKARAVIEYLDYQPLETLMSQAVLAAATRGRKQVSRKATEAPDGSG
jgi:hypothetical protein